MRTRLQTLWFVIGFMLCLNLATGNYAQTIERDIAVTASIDPSPADIAISISSDAPETEDLRPGDIVTVTLTYAPQPFSGFPLTLTSRWEEGLIIGSGNNYLPVFEYVIGSATPAATGEVPVVDLLNHEITWNIVRAGNVSPLRSVQYQLRVKTGILTEDRIVTEIGADGTYQSVVVAPIATDLFINPIPRPTPTPTQTPIPTPTSPPTQIPLSVTPTAVTRESSSLVASPTQPPVITPTPSPSPVVRGPDFVRISLDHVGAEEIIVSAITRPESRVKISYGACGQTQFSMHQDSGAPAAFHEFTVTQLQPDTVYCFQLVASLPLAGYEIRSDVYVVKTGTPGFSLYLQDARLTWESVPFSYEKTPSNYVLPRDVPLVITLTMSGQTASTKIVGSFQSRSVLGASTQSYGAKVAQVPFLEIAPGMYSAEIRAPAIHDRYRFILSVQSDEGHTAISLPQRFQVNEPIRVIDTNGAPVERARILLFRKEETSQAFVPIIQSFSMPQTRQGFGDAFETNAAGQLFMVLPRGEYRAQLSAHGFYSTESEFMIGESSESYPEFVMRANPTWQGRVDRYTYAFALVVARAMRDTTEFFGTRTLFVGGLVANSIFALIMGIVIGGKILFMGRLHGKVGRLVRELDQELIEMLMGGWSLLTIGASYLFYAYGGFSAAAPYVGISTILIAIDLWYLYHRHRTPHHAKSTSTSKETSSTVNIH